MKILGLGGGSGVTVVAEQRANVLFIAAVRAAVFEAFFNFS